VVRVVGEEEEDDMMCGRRWGILICRLVKSSWSKKCRPSQFSAWREDHVSTKESDE